MIQEIISSNFYNEKIHHNKYLHPLIWKVKWCLHKESGNITSSKTDLCIEGYPSSANSFFNVLINVLKPGLEISHHTHSLANIKNSFSYNVPCIILIREPLYAISSHVVRHSVNTTLAIQKYISFYDYIYENIKKIDAVIIFKILFNDTEKVINDLKMNMNWQYSLDYTEDIKNDINTYIKIWEKEYNGLKTTSLLPNEDKEIKKEEVQETVSNNQLFNTAKNLYNEIILSDKII